MPVTLDNDLEKSVASVFVGYGRRSYKIRSPTGKLHLLLKEYGISNPYSLFGKIYKIINASAFWNYKQSPKIGSAGYVYGAP